MAFWNKNEHFIAPHEKDALQAAIQKAESSTSGEIRIFIESRCPLVDTLNRAEEIFLRLKMQNTEHNNASLIYIAYKDREFALYGDRGCIIKFPKDFWKREARKLSYAFHNGQHQQGILNAIEALSKEYQIHFPDHGEAKNELPDEIVFGK